MEIRLETPDDIEGVHAVNLAAFETSAEAELVEALREFDGPFVSLVAEAQGEIVGHIMFTPVFLDDDEEFTIYGLGPMSVMPEFQKKGIGAALVHAGLERCIDIDVEAVVVLGQPEFYSKFGFVAASEFDINCEFEVPKEYFMALELADGVFWKKSGTVSYNPLFKAQSNRNKS